LLKRERNRKARLISEFRDASAVLREAIALERHVAAGAGIQTVRKLRDLDESIAFGFAEPRARRRACGSSRNDAKRRD
jgi:hypothetical protein